LYRDNPRAAAVEWHRNAKWGLFIHYALESLRGLTAGEALKAKAVSGDEWKKLKGGGDVDYARLKDRFTAERFDADFITDLALEAQMHYVNFTTRHRGDLYMFRTSVSEFTSLNSPARRDLVAELAEQCRKKGLGLFLYCPPDVARTEPQETFDRNRTVVRELLTQYGPVAGIWLDGIGSYYEEPEAYRRLDELYALIRSLQPHRAVTGWVHPPGRCRRSARGGRPHSQERLSGPRADGPRRPVITEKETERDQSFGARPVRENEKNQEGEANMETH
jgi:alpha-L-fucosidase